MLMFGVPAGTWHISHLAILGRDSVMITLFKWDRFPFATAFSRVFKLFSHRTRNLPARAENIMRRKMWGKKRSGKVTLDMDSTLRGVSGQRRGAERGYNL